MPEIARDFRGRLADHIADSVARDPSLVAVLHDHPDMLAAINAGPQHAAQSYALAGLTAAITTQVEERLVPVLLNAIATEMARDMPAAWDGMMTWLASKGVRVPTVPNPFRPAVAPRPSEPVAPAGK